MVGIGNIELQGLVGMGCRGWWGSMGGWVWSDGGPGWMVSGWWDVAGWVGVEWWDLAGWMGGGYGVVYAMG